MRETVMRFACNQLTGRSMLAWGCLSGLLMVSLWAWS
jgi:hypothetical protein